MALTALSALLGAAPVASIDDVIGLMSSIDDSLAPSDGVGWFNKLYRRVTERVAETLGDGTFENPAFIDRLDVVFANLYFQALHAFLTDPQTVPRAWSPLFDRNEESGLAPIQFALAGMNAHINRDLMVAVVRVCEEMNLVVADDSREKRDFDRLNPILQAVETQARILFLEGIVADLDILLGQVDTIVANWSLVEARSAAWRHAENLWRVRNIDFIEQAYIDSLDGLVGFAGRGLMVHALLPPRPRL
jgi:Family of unknown function (DUF5995)